MKSVTVILGSKTQLDSEQSLRKHSSCRNGTNYSPSLPQVEGRPISFDPNFHGPCKTRSCTDVICLFIFMVFIGAWAGLGIYAITQGDPNMLLVPTDSRGAHCGVDSSVRDKPYLFFFDITKCIGASVLFTGCPTTQVCVEKCPTRSYSANFMSDQDLLQYKMCDYDVVANTVEDVKKKIEEGQCAEWYLPSSSVQKRCLPTIANLSHVDTDTFPKLNTTDVITAIENIRFGEVGINVVQDIANCWWQILVGLTMAMFICIIYISIMRWIAPVVVWFSILGVIAILAFCVYITSIKYRDYEKATSEDEDFVDRYMNKDSWLALLIICLFVLVIILLVLLFLRKRIVLAIGLIREGSKAVASVTSALFFPLVPWILQVGVLTYTIAVGLYLTTAGSSVYKVKNFDSSCVCEGPAANYKNDSVCLPETFQEFCHEINKPTTSCALASCYFSNVDNPKYTLYLHAFNIFGFFWSSFFVSAMGQMIVATVFATWYWEWNKSDLPFFAVTSATAQTLRYHMGTLAFGSLIVAICRMIRVILEYIDHKLKKYDNPFTRAVLCCMKCFFWCLEKFLKFINRNAYIMCAIHGKNFCASAKDAFGLLMRNIVRVFVLDKVTDFLFFLSKLLLSVGIGCLAYTVFVYKVVDTRTNLNYDLVPVIVIAVCTYFIASIFFSVYNMAVDTLFLCFLEDCERNNGTPEKPYYMSRQLMKILGRKNKFH